MDSDYVNNMITIEGLCGICPGNCAVEIDLLESKIEGIRPSKKYSPAAICLRGSKAKHIVYSKDRIKTPLIRTGEKGEGKFKEATWDEALDYIADGFKRIIEKYGVQALASHVGRGGFDQAFDDFIGKSNPDGTNNGFFAPIGSPNNGGVGSLCYVAYGVIASQTLMGLSEPDIVPDYENAETIVIWGCNPPTGSPPFLFNKLRELRRKGTRIITVDHYDSIMSLNSDESFFVRSGSDIILINGIIKYLIENEIYDREFVENYTYGFEELVDCVKEFDVNRVCEVTGLSESQFYRLAQIVSGRRVALKTYTGLEYSNSGVQTIRAIYSLWAICGHLDKKGGLLLSPYDRNMYYPKLDIPKPVCEPFGSKEFPLFADMIGEPQFMKFPDAVLYSVPYKVAGLLSVGSCISINYPSSKVYEEALKALEMFVILDRFMTKDCLYADVILPSTTHFEDESYAVYSDKVRLRHRVIEPIGKARTDIFILHDIASRMGFGEYYPADDESMLKMRFGDMPEVLEELLEGKDEVILPPAKFSGYEKYRFGFNTPTGKFEFKSTLLESYGYHGLPVYTPAKEGRERSPEVFAEYPLILNTGARIQTTFRTQHLNIPELVKLQPHPLIHISREDALNRGINDGDDVFVITKRGRIEVVATISDSINIGDVELNIGGGSPFQLGKWVDANANYLTDMDNVDSISGFPCFKNLLCDVQKSNTNN